MRVNIFDKCKLYQLLEKHKKNLYWNLSRIYRLRNEIVHDAAIKKNIESIVAHQKFYLVFILNSVIDFFINHQVDINKDGKIDINDYFLMQDLYLSNIIKKGKKDKETEVDIEDLLRFSNPIDYLS